MPHVGIDTEGTWHIVIDGEIVCQTESPGPAENDIEIVERMAYTRENLDNPDPPWCRACLMFVDEEALPSPPRRKNSPTFDYHEVFSP